MHGWYRKLVATALAGALVTGASPTSHAPIALADDTVAGRVAPKAPEKAVGGARAQAAETPDRPRALGVAADDTQTHDGITFVAWTSSTSLPAEAGDYYLTANVTLDEAWHTPTGPTNLCLNGKTIAGNVEGDGSAVVWVSQGSAFGLYDCEESGAVKGVPGRTASGVHVAGGASFGLHQGTVSDCVVGVTVGDAQGEAAEAAMSGGTVARNGKTGVSVASGGSFSMSGGAIARNGDGTAPGGGVRVSQGSFELVGGAISDNEADDGGGIFLDAGTLVLGGGTIAGNSASTSGGGVRATEGSRVSVLGSPAVQDNAARGAASNIHLPQGVVLDVTGELGGGADMGITHVGGEGEPAGSAFTAGYATAGNASDPALPFASDHADYLVAYTANGEEARLVRGYAVAVDPAMENGSVRPDRDRAIAGDMVVLSVTPQAGYGLEGLTVLDASGNAVALADNAFVMPEGNVMVKATFAAERRTVTFDANGGTGQMGPQTAAAGAQVTLAPNAFARSGYSFSGWNTKADGTGTSYQNGATVRVESDMTLYAQWLRGPAGGSASGRGRSGGSTPQTSDPTTLAGVAALVATGAGVAAVGAALRKRSRRTEG